MQACNEPNWHNLTDCASLNVPDKISQWLHAGSITKALKATCSKYHITLNHQDWSPTTASEAQILEINNNTKCVARETIQHCDGIPAVAARSIFPETLFSGKESALHQLGTKSLGELLFSDPSMQRNIIQVALIEPKHFLFSRLLEKYTDEEAPLWSRRCIYQVSGKKLLVCELFLSTVPEHPD